MQKFFKLLALAAVFAACVVALSCRNEVDAVDYSAKKSTCTVAFNMNGHGTQIEPQEIEKGGTATEPKPPTAEGQVFRGWFADEAFTSEFSFDAPVTKPTTIWAKWGFYLEDAIALLEAAETIGDELFIAITEGDTLGEGGSGDAETGLGQAVQNHNGKVHLDLSQMSIDGVADYAFYMCSALASIKLPKTVESLGESMFGECYSLEKIEIDADNPDFKSEGGIVFSKDGKTIWRYPAGKTDSKYVIPQGVETVALCAFEDCTLLEEVKIPDGVKTIDNYAFYHADSLERVNLPDGLESLGEQVFMNCSKLESIDIPSSLVKMGYAVFQECDSLKTATFNLSESAVTALELGDGIDNNHAFMNCSALTHIYVPKGTVDAYKNKFPKYADKIEELPEA